MTFECFSYRKVMWKHGNNPLPYNAEAYRQDEVNNILKINNLKVTNTGKYTCLSEDPDYVMFEDDVYLKILGKYLNYLYLLLIVQVLHHLQVAHQILSTPVCPHWLGTHIKYIFQCTVHLI